MPRIKPRSSRRVPPLKDSDFDHEIILVNHSTPASRRQSQGDDSRQHRRSSSQLPVLAGPSLSDRASQLPDGDSDASNSQENNRNERPTSDDNDQQLAPVETGKSVSRSTVSRSKSNGKPRVRARAPTTESAVDVLYENQRGGFLCGMALFSSRALGNLDPTPWTNVVHKASPTDITNAQVPDPSWEWAWPEWRVNHDEATDADEDGWEYSFMFARAFSWHGPRWWNSFVRRRAWIRRRVKKRNGSGNGNGSGNYAAQDPFGFRGEYFTVEHDPTLSPTLSPTADGDGDGRSPSRVTSQAESSKAGTTAGQTAGVEDVGGPILEDVDSLLRVLRSCRIDREKIEAVENYLEHASGDMEGLQEEIHHIITLFVFQASRRLLLSRLTEVLDETQAKLKSKESGPESATSLERRADNLSAAIKHADEEVRRLEYWSDVKEMVESGESMGAVDGDKGWDEAGLEGLDQSGPARPNSPK